MNARNVLFLAGTVALSTLAAWHRFGDSAHAMGVVRSGGGAARHPVALEGGRGSYVLVATAAVIPPYRGDVRVGVEGDPAMGWDLELSRPILDLGLHRWPSLEGDVLRGLAPLDRLALWVRLRPPAADPVCGMACPGEGAPRASAAGREECFCSETCREAFLADPGRHPPRRVEAGRWTLAFRDLASGRSVLSIPIHVGGEEAGHAGAHH